MRWLGPGFPLVSFLRGYPRKKVYRFNPVRGTRKTDGRSIIYKNGDSMAAQEIKKLFLVFL
jgi:hypothetical protein